MVDRTDENDRGLMRNYMGTALERWASLQISDKVYREFYGIGRTERLRAQVSNIEGMR